MVLSIVLIGVAAVILAGIEYANDDARRRTHETIVGAIDDEIASAIAIIGGVVTAEANGQGRTPAQIVQDQDTRQRIGEAAGLSASAVLGEDHRLIDPVIHDPDVRPSSSRAVALMLEHLTSTLLVEKTPETVRSSGQSRPPPDRLAWKPDAPLPATGMLIWHNGRPVIAAAVSAGTGAARATIIGIRRLTPERLQEIGHTLPGGSVRLLLAPSGTPEESIHVAGPPGETGGSIVWMSPRPGDGLIQRFLPIGFGALALLLLVGTLAYAVLWRTLSRMADNEALAHHLAGHDMLSGLPNRTLFTDRLKDALAAIEGTSFGVAVFFIDLDKFKHVNDTHGHASGDKLIVECAARVRHLIRAEDTLSRFGGDEFAIIQTNISDMSDAEMLARRINDALSQPFFIGGVDVFIGASIGVAVAPNDSSDTAELMRLADIAMYRAKSEGRNRTCFFEPRMDETLRMRKLVEDDLRHAIENDHLKLVYQPQVSSDGSRIIAVEALLRWHHPVHGVIPPNAFISIAEERGLIVQLGEWVVRRACRDGLRWPGLTVACNVSAIQFKHRDFVPSIARVLEQSGFDAKRLELELTESVVVDDADNAERSIVDLRAMGVRIALDDFGTGYSSLIYLRRFAFDKIKIDKSFLDSMEATGESAILIHSVVHLGRALGLIVTAEGVETRDQHRFLQAVGCHLLQGYLFSRPVPAEEIDRLLTLDTPFDAAA